jgi:penicillin-binding protein 2
LAASLATGLRVTATFLHGPTPSFAPLRVGAATLSLVRAGMRDVVLPGGTAGQVAGLQHFRIAAKTGTADYEASGGERLNQAWFVGYAPADPGETPRIAFAAVRAHTHDKGADAAPLVARALEALARTHPGERWW